MSDKKYVWKRKLSMGKLWKTSEEVWKHYYVQMQILDNLSFSRCAAPLHVVAVIFRKRILTESGT